MKNRKKTKFQSDYNILHLQKQLKNNLMTGDGLEYGFKSDRLKHPIGLINNKDRLRLINCQEVHDN